MKAKTPKNYAVMAQRVEATDSLDYFPTPPWATRALIAHILMPRAATRPLNEMTCWEPAAGEGHMAEVLREYFAHVHASDVHDYSKGYPIGDFIGGGLLGRAECPHQTDWVITNPPFNTAAQFLDRALSEARTGVALLLRTSWLESEDRYVNIFKDRAPAFVCQFSERVAMIKGRWNPDASSATSYAWFVWRAAETGQLESGGVTVLQWIPPGCKNRLTRADDRRRFAGT